MWLRLPLHACRDLGNPGTCSETAAQANQEQQGRLADRIYTSEDATHYSCSVSIAAESYQTALSYQLQTAKESLVRTTWELDRQKRKVYS